jgi:phosphoribosylanthranilate isomerase
MKINGFVVTGPQTEVVVIPRGEVELVIRAQAVLDYTDFDKLNPIPKPPVKMLAGGVTQENVEDPKYKERLSAWAQQKTDWMIIKSLSATECIEWETVKMDQPDTWKNYRDELESVFTPDELSKIMEAVLVATGLTQSKIEEATKRFLATQGSKR